MKLNECLKKLRQCSGYTQQNVADALGIDRSSYTYYETGKTIPPLSTVAKLANLYNVSIEELLGKQPEKKGHTLVLNAPKMSRPLQHDLEKFKTLSKDEQSIILAYRAMKDKARFIDFMNDYIVREVSEADYFFGNDLDDLHNNNS